MRVRVAVTLAAVAVAIVGARADAGAQATKLIGMVGDPASISLKDEGGTAVANIAPGAYDIDVSDASSAHNFHLTGQAVSTS